MLNGGRTTGSRRNEHAAAGAIAEAMNPLCAQDGDAGPKDHAIDHERALEPGRGRQAEAPEQIPALGWYDITWRVARSAVADRILSTSGGVAFFALLAIFPGIAASVSLIGLFADARSLSEQWMLLSGILPSGVLDLVRAQIQFVAQQEHHALGLAFVVGLCIALVSANSGVAELFNALNIVYHEKEKRGFVRFYTTTLLFTLAGTLFAALAIFAVVVLPVVFTIVGPARVTERLLSFLRWPLLLAVLIASLSFVYRYGPSRQNARWRWVTWGSVAAAFAWVGASILFSWYVATFDSYTRLYGALSAIVGFMVWLWISAVIILLGGKMNAEMEHQTAQDTTRCVSRPIGSRGAMVADHVGRSHDA